MSGPGVTEEQSWGRREVGGKSSGAPVPGLVLLFSGAEPQLRAIRLERGVCQLGRGHVGGVPLDDACMSRSHAEVRLDGTRFRVRDLGSRNGTFVDGERLEGERVVDGGRVLRVGDTLFVLRRDVRAYLGAVVEHRDGVVLGPTLRARWDQVALAARSGETLHLTGESGTGKELAARLFHSSGPRAAGPFVAVNCAAVPQNLAERLLFGARRGAFSGADADVDGYLQAAHGGTLLLDEIAELDAQVQAKLLRAIESREVLPLGAARPRRIDFAICSATHQSLRAHVAARRFRDDLYFRLARPEVVLPPLRERVEDIPWIVKGELERAGAPPMHASLVEACLLRRWPGNVRELIVEVRGAAMEAERKKGARVVASHLPPDAGKGMEPLEAPSVARGEAPPVDRAVVIETLRREGGNVSRTARALGWHRTQLRRWLARHEVDAKDFGGADDEGEEPPARE